MLIWIQNIIVNVQNTPFFNHVFYVGWVHSTELHIITSHKTSSLHSQCHKNPNLCLSCVDTCHVMGMVHLCKLWSLVYFLTTVKGNISICLLNELRCVVFPQLTLYLTSRQVCVVGGVGGSWYHFVHWVVCSLAVGVCILKHGKWSSQMEWH